LVTFALALNFLLAPAFAWLLTVVIPLERGHAIALLLLGGAAGAPFLPKLAESARGDLGFAVALMVLLTAGTILFLPFGLPIMIPGLHANAWLIARPLLLLIVLPLVAGMLVKGWAASFARRMAPILAIISNTALLLLFALLFFLNLRALLGVIGSGAILAAILYAVGLFALSWLSSRPFEQRKVLALGTAARNFGAALVPAVSNFADPKITVALIVNAIVGLAFSFAAAAWLRGRKVGLPPGAVAAR
jgi:BASS family bile acid:Na+ symporter